MSDEEVIDEIRRTTIIEKEMERTISQRIQDHMGVPTKYFAHVPSPIINRLFYGLTRSMLVDLATIMKHPVMDLRSLIHDGPAAILVVSQRPMFLVALSFLVQVFSHFSLFFFSVFL